MNGRERAEKEIKRLIEELAEGLCPSIRQALISTRPVGKYGVDVLVTFLNEPPVMLQKGVQGESLPR